MHKVIEKLQQTTTVTGRSGRTHTLFSRHKQKEGLFLYNLIRADCSVRKTLEIGCAYGLSALHICAATEDRDDTSHTIIDPHQNTLWDGVGIRNLYAAGFDSFDLLEKPSEFAMPILAQKEEATFDLVLVNGWHTFDHALVDCFYATRLLRLGGYLVLDSVALKSIRRVVELLNQWPCYEEFASVREPLSASATGRVLSILLAPIQRTACERALPSQWLQKLRPLQATRMVAFKKSECDTRDSRWHYEQT